jgi:hypothetical protein
MVMKPPLSGAATIVISLAIGAGIACTSGSGSKTPTTGATPQSTQATDTGLTDYADGLREALLLSSKPSATTADALPLARATRDALTSLTVPSALRSQHAELLRRIGSYVQFIERQFERRPVLLDARIEANSFDVFEACVAVQRQLTAKGVNVDIGCAQPSLTSVRECLTQKVTTIPGGKFAINNEGEARAQAEQLYGASLPWPTAVPSWVAQYDASPMTLYSPRFLDGDPQFVDSLKDRRTGVVVAFRDAAAREVMRVRYSPVPECQTSPVYFATPEGVRVTYTFESNIDDLDGRLYDIVMGEFALPTTFVHMDLVYRHPDVPSDTVRGSEFITWADSLIAGTSPR